MDELDLLLTDGHLAQEIGAERAAVLPREELRQYRPVGQAPEYLVWRVGRVLSVTPIMGERERDEVIRRAGIMSRRVREREQVA
jgi:hypothetical protein